MNGGRIGVFTSGLWDLRDVVAALTDMTPVRRRFTARGLAAVAGWGHKPTAAQARRAAARAGLPYVAIEDGFLRARAADGARRSLSYVCDREGVYYDARGPSALERLIRARAADPAGAAAAAAPVVDMLRRLGVSKYNPPVDRRDLDVMGDDPAAAVLVIDQTAGDAALEGAGVGPADFAAMLAAAVAENPGARVVIKTHPEVGGGRKRGLLDAGAVAAAAARDPAVDDALRAGRLVRLAAPATARDLAARAQRAYAASSLLGFELLLLGARVSCFGQAFYAGWGLTDDRRPAPARRGAAPLAALAAAAYVDYTRCLCPDTLRPMPLERAAALLADPSRAAGG